LLRGLDARHRRGELIIIVTADHGEQLVAAGRTHGLDVGDDQIHVPLIVRAPHLRPGRIEEAVSIVDIMPTVLAATRTPAPAGLDGFDLGAPPPPLSRSVLAETWHISATGRFEVDRIAAFDRHAKVVHDRLAHTSIVERAIPGDEPEHLFAAIRQYLEETGGPPRFRE
jgi:arylsulfatase A-like enzyme